MSKKKLPCNEPVKIDAPSGYGIVTRENHSTPIISFCVYFPGGALHETAENQGITALMQRLLIKGTVSRSAEEVARELEFLGAYLSPFTGKEAFGLSMSAVSKHFYPGVEIFADCILNPRFTEEELEKEKRNILIEIERRKDDTLNYCLERCDGELFGDNPYGFTLIGRKESVSRITRDDILKWHQCFYRPERMILSLVGDVKTRIVQERFLHAFSTFKGNCFAPPPEFSKKLEMEKKSVVEEREKRQVVIVLGFLAPPLVSDEYFPFKVLDYLLSGMGSRLFINLRDREGLAYVVSSSYSPRKNFGSFKSYMQTSPDKQERALKGLLRELDTLKDEGPSLEEVERTKHYMLGLHEIALQKKWAQASKMAFYELMGLGTDFLDKYPDRIKKVTASQVLKVARKFLDTERVTCSMIVPKGSTAQETPRQSPCTSDR